MINIVLLQPEIPQNTGNIARTCAATGSRLHLVAPLGFKIDDTKLKRAGLDYWHLLDIVYYSSTEEFFSKNPAALCWFFTTKAKKSYCDVKYEDNCYLVFGRETAGIDEDILYKNYKRCVRLPMVDEARSLNLSNTVAVACFEAKRQLGFPEMKREGKLTKY